MFVTQVPTLVDFTGRASTFGNHLTGVDSVIRGGDLMIRYPDGTLRNLTKDAGFGSDGMQGATGIAVREPTIHWSGTKALFSMLVGSPTEPTAQASFFWQIYEVSNFGQGQTVTITKVANQPAGYNNVSPIYATDDRVLFTSDRPRSGLSYLYPNLDEYESAPAVSGIWSLDPVSGDLHLLNHTPSGVFSPMIDSFGRLLFIRWDHLQRDQAADAGDKGAFNFVDESASAASTGNDTEIYPEPRLDTTQSTYGPVQGMRFNVFTPWQMNDDGTAEETLNHVGRHELNFGFLGRSFTNDPSLSDSTDDTQHANKKTIVTDGGLFQLREDPTHPGNYLAVMAEEFGSLATNQIVQLTGAPTLNGDQMVVTDVTPNLVNDNSPGGRFRNPLPLSSGGLVATYTAATLADPTTMGDFRLKLLNKNATTGLYDGGPQAQLLTPGIVKTVTWFNPGNFSAHPSFSGPLWEMEAVEVVARTRPAKVTATLDTPESNVFAEQGVDATAFKAWLATNNLALIVSRNTTSRDDADIQQPFNLEVAGGGTKTVSAKRTGPVYDIAYLQIFQADQIRAYSKFTAGRRNIAQVLHDPTAIAKNPPNPTGPVGSVKIGADGSIAAFVPARRALTWQTTDVAGTSVVRERMWLTFQPGEVRVCSSCHGVNAKDQAGRLAPTNEPEALGDLLAAWKLMPK